MALAGSVYPVYYQFFPSLIQHRTRQLTHLLILRVTMEVMTTYVAFTLYKIMSNWRIKGKTIMISYYELVAMIRKLKAHIIFISETKIDSTFHIP
ncbi:unnamed protein product [Porites lobata]|uniref:Uncharacterized protein n=1 Tax=Porites lobata TaxID=104759 RepID=A0ABN8NTX4_9CNID|nr:unnamed protein product [Porites lobata]